MFSHTSLEEVRAKICVGLNTFGRGVLKTESSTFMKSRLEGLILIRAMIQGRGFLEIVFLPEINHLQLAQLFVTEVAFYKNLQRYGCFKGES